MISMVCSTRNTSAPFSKQRLPRRHDKVHDAAAQFFVGVGLSALHCPSSLKK